MAAIPPPDHPGRSLPTNPTQRKTTAIPGKEIKRKHLTYAVQLEIVKLVESGQSKSSVETKFGINESTVRGIYQKKESTGVKKKGVSIREIKKLLEYRLQI